MLSHRRRIREREIRVMLVIHNRVGVVQALVGCMHGSGGKSTTEDDDGMLCVDGAVGDTTPLRTGLPVYSKPHKVGTCS